MHGTRERRRANGCSAFYRHLSRKSRKNDAVVKNDESTRRRRIAAANRLSIRDGRRPLTAPSHPSKLRRAFRLRVRIIPNRSNRHVDPLHRSTNRHLTRHGRRPLTIPLQSSAYVGAFALRIGIIPNRARINVERVRGSRRNHQADQAHEAEHDNAFHTAVSPFYPAHAASSRLRSPKSRPAAPWLFSTMQT
jgi:hypothetical protein